MRKSLAFCLIILTLMLPWVEFTKSNDSTTFIGFSGYIVSEAELEKTLTHLKDTELNTYRVSFRPSWSAYDSQKSYNTKYIDYLLQNTDLFIIVDGNHLYPADEQSVYAQNHWTEVIDRVFEVLSSYRNNSRVAVELINEYVLSDYDIRIQELINDIRTQGYNNTIITNKYSTPLQPWHKFEDPIDATYQGMHFYFNTWNAEGALSQINIALSKNITNLLDTEVGASHYEYTDYDQENIDELDTFLIQCQALGVGNCIWTNNDTKNLETYRQYELSLFPPPSPTPHPTTSPTKNQTQTTIQSSTQTPSPQPTTILTQPTETKDQEQTKPSPTYKETHKDTLLTAGIVGVIIIASTLGALLYIKKQHKNHKISITLNARYSMN